MDKHKNKDVENIEIEEVKDEEVVETSEGTIEEMTRMRQRENEGGK